MAIGHLWFILNNVKRKQRLRQFSNIYDSSTIRLQSVKVSGAELLGFSKTIVIPEN